MRKRRNVILGLTISGWLAIACTSGVGALATIDNGNDRPPSTREKPGEGRESPGESREVPPNGREPAPPGWDNPGSQGGGPGAGGGGGNGNGNGNGGGGADNCPPCDLKLDCTVNGAKRSVILKNDNGKCSAGDGITFDCAGKVYLNDNPIGTWSRTGDVLNANVTIDGNAQSLSCTKAAEASTVPAGPGTGSASAETEDRPPPEPAVPDAGQNQ